MKQARREQGRNALDLIEEATHLLRTAPVSTLAVYYAGAIPFVLGLLFFWADMSRNPFAPGHLAGASFSVAALFFWMKFCHTLFARRVRAQMTGENHPPPGFRRCARMFFMQAVIQPSGLFVVPLALIPALPFAWVYAFYQNATVLDDGGESDTTRLLKKSWAQARLWPRQNHILLAILFIFAFCVFLNWATVCLILPGLCKMLLGIETSFTKSPLAMLNTTFFTAMFSLTYLCVDPILKTIYALRCFYGEALQSGEDLKAELRPFIRAAAKSAALVLVLSTMLPAPSTRAASTNAPAAVAGQVLAPADLDRTINQTIHERKYVWRMPREQVEQPESDQGVIAKFFTKVGDMLRDCVNAISKWFKGVLHKLFRGTPHVQSSASGYGWILSLQILLYGLVAAVIVALAILLWRVWRNRRPVPAAVVSQPIQPAPDLADENVGADVLPEDGWTKLARELLARGEFRLAMRAFYLASLAHLAAQNLINIARFKSNRDYERELRRRAHSIPGLLGMFGDNVSVFERVWYGTHPANGETVLAFAASVEKLKAGG